AAVADPLESLHCTLVSVVGEGEGVAAEVWARDDAVRTEVVTDTRRVVSIQRGGVLFSWVVGEETGVRRLLGSGLAGRGLIRQIAEVRQQGEPGGTVTVEGVDYEVYILDRYPGEKSLVYLSRDRSLPGMWVNVEERGGERRETRMFFRDAASSERPCDAANVALEDGLFRIPAGVRFQMEE
ncbi:MAG: hypothetical protein PHF72_14950, partial [Gammaproteobacteria bacterium]|nr:hypothetical protein [Gammaproteobacteria bacterium]